jgi:hypothetical protein
LLSAVNHALPSVHLSLSPAAEFGKRELMFRFLTQLFCLSLTLLVSGSSGSARESNWVGGSIRIAAARLENPGIKVSVPLAFVSAWEMTSDHHAFGGISALIKGADGFLALSDIGALIRFRMSRDEHILGGTVMPLPTGCLPDMLETSRDTESLTQDPASGQIWIGFEDRNAVCRANGDGTEALAVYAPPDMQKWRRTRGPESMVRLHDGRFLIIAEEPPQGGNSSPVLLFDRDPTDPAARRIHLRYQPPAGFHPTDVVELPDGHLLVLNRRLSLPFRFASQITIVDPPTQNPDIMLKGPTVATMESPGLNDNFEALALSQNGGRTFLWVMSDDNYIPLQRTYLLLFEIKQQPRP